MRFGLDVAQQRVSWDELVSRVRFAEELGFDGAWGFDHFRPMYGEGPGETFEGMTTLAALSGLTSRIRLGLLVAGVTYRHPSLYATQAMTIDHASGGRLELSFGAAWFQEEHDELGFPFPATGNRFDLLEDTLEIVTRLATGEVVTYEGKSVSLRDAQVLPCPVQRPHPPIWIGGSGPRRTLPLVARFADVWHAWGSPSSLVEANELVDRLATDAGRDPAAITRASSLSLDDLDTASKHAAKWHDAGYGYLVCGWPAEGRAQIERFATQVMPAYAA
ncbi:LLM class flavin-dependent oxidoreductase [Candidatus Poriferisocius sp.]|uniref:LLM class flavin-dependent oxidoreductase n=1 Tax=Candidatus Poriferisocius sp. TaxID=3101276 RepID=UPI003B59CB0C